MSNLPEFRLPLDVSNANLELIYERLREHGHEDDASIFYGDVWLRACDAVSDDGIAGWKLSRDADYVDADAINLLAAERLSMASDLGLTPYQVSLSEAVVAAYEAGETDTAEVFQRWHGTFKPAETVFVTTADRADITLARKWVTEYLGVDAVVGVRPDADITAEPETVVKWIVLAWTVLFEVVNESEAGLVSEPVLAGVSNENFLRGLDEFHSIYTFPFISAPADDPFWLLEAGYSAYDADDETGIHVYSHEDYEKAVIESSVFKDLPTDWKLKILRD